MKRNNTVYELVKSLLSLFLFQVSSVVVDRLLSSLVHPRPDLRPVTRSGCVSLGRGGTLCPYPPVDVHPTLTDPSRPVGVISPVPFVDQLTPSLVGERRVGRRGAPSHESCWSSRRNNVDGRSHFVSPSVYGRFTVSHETVREVGCGVGCGVGTSKS